jgi:hypothetical protein
MVDVGLRPDLVVIGAGGGGVRQDNDMMMVVDSVGVIPGAGTGNGVGSEGFVGSARSRECVLGVNSVAFVGELGEIDEGTDGTIGGKRKR